MRRVALVAAFTCALAAGSSGEARASRWSTESVARLGGYYSAAFAGNARGRRAIAWVARDLHVAIARPGEQFGRDRLVRHEHTDLDGVWLAMNSRGDLLLVWRYFDKTFFGDDSDPTPIDDSCCYGARAAVLRRDGRLGPVRTLTPRGVSARVEGYAIDRRRRYGVIWHGYGGGEDRQGVLGRFSSGHGLGPLRVVDRADEGVLLALVHGRPRVLVHEYANPDLFERIARAD